MKRICVYCGSASGAGEAYLVAARGLGALFAEREIELVYGGARVGVMGAIADAVLDAGGKVSGVIPQQLFEKEVAHSGLTELHVVHSMHERKSLMAVLSDAFVAMPGGFGTLEEIIETLTWGQLQFHSKPCGFLNVDGFFDHLLAYFDHAAGQGFIRTEHRQMPMVSDSAENLLNQFERYEAPKQQKW